MSVFDGLADVFADTFGEPVSYTPIATGVPIGTGSPPAIQAIWLEDAVDAQFADADTDAIRPQLHVRAADVPVPVEGDLAVRVKTGKSCKVVPPIRPDDKGMIVCGLALTD
jgi:hypothetical protein